MNFFSLDVPASGEISRAKSKDVEDERFDLTARKTSWFDLHILRRSLGMIMKAVESMISYKNSLLSTRVIMGNDPQGTTSR